MNDGPGKSFMKNLDCAEGYQNDGSTESEQAKNFFLRGDGLIGLLP
jgi:hypothetical protein